MTSITTTDQKDILAAYHRAKMNAYLAALNIPPPPPERKEKWATLLKEAKESNAIPAFPTMWEWAMFENLADPDDVRHHMATKQSVQKIKYTLRNAYKTYAKDTHYAYVEELAVTAGIELRAGPRQRRKDLREWWERRQEQAHPPPPATTQTFEEWVKMNPYKPVAKTLEDHDWNPYKTCE